MTVTTSPRRAHTQPTDLAARAVGLTKVYGSGPTAVTALDTVDVSFTRGTFTAVMGASGSGKSTLMHCLAGLDTVTSGHVLIGDADLTTLPDGALTRLRRDRIGFIFQSFNLLPTLTARQNISLPLDLAGRGVERGLFDQIVGSLEIGDRLDHLPSELSGGQQQRVAIARALISEPHVIFADEPTGALDSRTGQALLAYLRSRATDDGQTIVMVTHDPLAAAWADRVLILADGHLTHDLHEPDTDTVLGILRDQGRGDQARGDQARGDQGRVGGGRDERAGAER